MEHMIRPKAIVLPESAQVPGRNLIDPPPNQFTHEVTARQPFYYLVPSPAAAPDGELPAGAKVVLLVHDGGEVCQVADARGLYVTTSFAGLRRLE